VVVLTNVMALVGNSFMRLWMDAMARSGATVLPLGRTTVLARGDRRPAWVHVQWPERAVGDPSTRRAVRNGASFVLLVLIARLRGARVLLTAHNTWAHDSPHPRMERLLYRFLGLVTTDIHLMSEAGGAEFFASHPNLRKAARHCIPLGNYAPLVDGVPSHADARRQLDFEPDQRVFMVFGALKRYKGVEEVVRAFQALDDDRARLIVAGRVMDPQLGQTLERAGRSDRRLRLIGGFVDEDELMTLIRASDHVVLPYRRVLNSASAMLALTLGRPVVLPRTATFEALRDQVGDGWVALFDDRLGASQLAELPVPGGSPELAWCDWELISRQLSELWLDSSR
jgi:glycosyltransferase involved in cell wall biosynthesis